MWYKTLERTNFLINLYDEIPSLKKVRISEINIYDEGQVIAIFFDMPKFADSPPQKWINNGYNRVSIRLDFSGIQKLEIKSDSNDYKGEITINKDNIEEVIVVKITGTINVLIKAESGFIQSINGYCSVE